MKNKNSKLVQPVKENPVHTYVLVEDENGDEENSISILIMEL